MPIPVITDHALVQVVMRPDTVPTSNSFVNTFFFRNDTFPDDFSGVFADDVKSALDTFYGATNGSAAAPISHRLSSIIDPALTQYRLYDLGTPAPRVPVLRNASAWTITSGEGYPNEVAAVISYASGARSVAGGGTADPTRRGRLFIGPLGVTAGLTQSGSQDVKLTDAFRLALAESAENLLNSSLALQWMQYSRKENRMAEVTGGFVNDRFDTQRRRGAESSARTLWPN